MVISILVIEDLAMAVYLPLVGLLLVGGGVYKRALSVSIALAIVFAVLLVAVRYAESISGWVCHESDGVMLLTTFGVLLLVAGLAQWLRVSAPIAAFLAGIVLSGPMCERSGPMLAPLRDLFAAIFFFFFGLEIDPI